MSIPRDTAPAYDPPTLGHATRVAARRAAAGTRRTQDREGARRHAVRPDRPQASSRCHPASTGQPARIRGQRRSFLRAARPACQMSASLTRASPDRGTPWSHPVAEGLQAIRATGYGPAGCWRRARSPASMTRTHPEARLPDDMNGTDQALHASSTLPSGHHSPATDDAPRDRQNGSGPRSPQNPHTTRASQSPPAPCGRHRSHAFTLFRGQISKLPR